MGYMTFGRDVYSLQDSWGGNPKVMKGRWVVGRSATDGVGFTAQVKRLGKGKKHGQVRFHLY